MTGSVGIIANPESGRDIRRLVARASVFDNMEKVSMVQRLLSVFDAAGLDRVLVMPDGFGIGERALELLPERPSLSVEFLDMRPTGTWRDSLRAAREMRREGVDVIVVIGGDGTNRVVAKGCGDVPLMPLSTGTNNVFPYMVEATTAALAVSALALGVVSRREGTLRSKRVLVRAGDAEDLALVDAALTLHQFVGCRAVWDPGRVAAVAASRAVPWSIGLSSIPGVVRPVGPEEDLWILARLGEGGRPVAAPVAPGLVRRVPLSEVMVLPLGEGAVLGEGPCVVALDGEREVEVPPGVPVEVTADRGGPLVVDLRETLRLASERGFFSEFGEHL